jgi:hypothetical protein
MPVKIKNNFKENGRNVSIAAVGMAEAPERVMEAAVTALQAGGLFVVATAQREYLQGPRPERLGEVTGRLQEFGAIEGGTDRRSGDAAGGLECLLRAPSTNLGFMGRRT